MSRALIILILGLLVFSIIPLSVSHDSAQMDSVRGIESQVSPSILNLQISGPSYAYFGQQVNIYLNSTYGFTNYSLTLYIAGYNLSGLAPQAEIHFYNASKGNFVQQITVPNYAQTLILYGALQVSSSSGIMYANDSIAIQVQKPIILNAIISNPTQVPMYNVTVFFSIDGTLVDTDVVPYVAPYSKMIVNVSIDPSYPLSLSQGKHSVTITINNAQARVNGQTSYSSSFYYGTPPNYDWIYYVAAAVVIFMAFLVFTSGRRRNIPRKPKWKK
jgi:hypothetical protein